MLFIDVRTKKEFDEGHIKGAIQMDYGSVLNEIEKYVTDLDAPIGLYCYAGVRSAFALMLLESVGYTNAVNLGCYDVLKTHYEYVEPVIDERMMPKLAEG